MFQSINFLRAGRVVLGALALSIVTVSQADGGVFVLTNEPSNKVAVYSRSTSGTLQFVDAVSTGGQGSGAGLGSQGALQLSEDGKWLLAVNAGSNDVSVFAVNSKGLNLVDREASGGANPISLTLHGNLVYVLNAGGTGNLSGFRLANNGHLNSLAGSSRAFSGADVGPAEVQFSPDGDLLVVTEKVSSKLSVYSVGENGLVTSQVAQNSLGSTPFGFSFGKRGRLFVSEAPGSAVSSYATWDDGTLVPISPSVPDTQKAACWIVVTPNGKFVYTANAGSGTISGYAIKSDGSLSLLNANGQTGMVGEGSTLLDMAVSKNGQFLYVIARGYGAVYGFKIGSDGSLTPAGHVTGLPTTSTTGIAAW